MTTEIRDDGSVWCPKCNEFVHVLSIRKAIKVADSSRRSLYRFIQSGEVMTFRLAGNSIRVCPNCLLQPTWEPEK